jgi:hypothetical protein
LVTEATVETKYKEFMSPDDRSELIRFLDREFTSDHGISLGEILIIIDGLHTCYRPPRENSGFPVTFEDEEYAITTVARNSGFGADAVRCAVAGLTLRACDLELEPHEPWQPKRARRFIRRPILALASELKSYLCWTDAILLPSVDFILQDISFGRMPSEWAGPSVNAALAKYLDGVRKRWECQVYDAFALRGLRGGRNLKALRGIDDQRIRVGPGEIDCLVVDATRLAVAVVEVKRLQPTYSPPEFVDEVRLFDKEDYVDRILSKVEWVHANWQHVRMHLIRRCRISDVPETPSAFHGCIVTKYESYAQVIDQRVAIVSAARLFREFDCNGRWLFAE